jgi:hypothetical protein
VADGAVIWNCLRSVKARVARRSFGIGYFIPYDATNPVQLGRELKQGPDAVIRVGPVWDRLLSKVWLPMWLCAFRLSKGDRLICYRGPQCIRT